MIEISITSYPYAVQEGTLKIPKDLKTPSEIKKYIEDHWDHIQFDIPDLDYVGADYEYYT